VNWQNSPNSFKEFSISNINTTGKMIGATGGFYFTPQTTGEVLINYEVNLDVPVDVIIELRYGTGSAPADGAVATGLLAVDKMISYSGNLSISTIVSGLTASTQYWFALCLRSVSGTISNLFYGYINGLALELAGAAGASGTSGTSGSSGILNNTTPASGIDVQNGLTQSILSTIYNSNLDSSLAMPSTVGGISSGTTVAQLTGLNLVQLFDDLLFPTVDPTYTIPQINISSTITGTREIGLTISPVITLTGTENDGGPYTQLLLNKNINSAGNSTFVTVSSTSSMTVVATTNIASQFGYSDPNNPNLTYQISTTDTISVPAPASGGSSTIVYSGAGDYSAGLAKKNNKGVTHSDTSQVRLTTNPQASSTNFASNSLTITGFYPYFYGKTATQKTASEIKTIIESGSDFTKVVANGTGSLSMVFNATGEWPWFAVYSSFSTKTAWFENALNNGSIGGVTDLFASPTTLSVTSPDGYWVVTYKIYPANKVTTIGTATIS
jgi:hypothetical protein